MQKTISVQATARTTVGRAAMKTLRTAAQVPGIIYGHGVAPMQIQLDLNSLTQAYSEAGESTLVEVVVDGATSAKALIHDIQLDPVGNQITHVDFYLVNMKEKIHAEIELAFEGVAPAEKTLGGVFVHNLDHIQVTCLPSDLVHHIVVDISTLKNFDDSIRVADLTIPPGLDVQNDPQESVCLVAPPRSEEELSALNEAVEENVEAVEVATEKPAEAGADEGEVTATDTNKQ